LHHNIHGGFEEIHVAVWPDSKIIGRGKRRISSRSRRTFHYRTLGIPDRHLSGQRVIRRCAQAGCWQSSGGATKETLRKKEFAGGSNRGDAIQAARFATIHESLGVIRWQK